MMTAKPADRSAKEPTRSELPVFRLAYADGVGPVERKPRFWPFRRARSIKRGT